MVHFVGAGPGAADLITVRGLELLKRADAVIYAGSLVNRELLLNTKPSCESFNSAEMTLEEVIATITARRELDIVRLHTGDPSIFGAIREQMDALDAEGIAFDVCPGVSSFCGAAAALKTEFTLPNVSQTVILTRMEGKTSVPVREAVELLASHGSSMVIFLTAGMIGELSSRLINGGFEPDAPAAIVSRATWDDEQVIRTTVAGLPAAAKAANITKTALITVGGFLAATPTDYDRSKLYDPEFTTEFRPATR